jgi:hypothetical protein
MSRCHLAIAPLFFLCAVLAGCGSAGRGATFVPTNSITPSVVSFSFSSATPQTFTVSEPGYTGTFSATSSNTEVVTIAAGDSTSARRRDDTSTSTTFTVTPVGGGNATITVSDDQGHSTAIPVSVTGATFTPQLQR